MKVEIDLRTAVTEKIKLRNENDFLEKSAGVGNESRNKNQSSRNEENTRNDSYEEINQKNEELEKEIEKVKMNKMKIEKSYDEVR